MLHFSMSTTGHFIMSTTGLASCSAPLEPIIWRTTVFNTEEAPTSLLPKDRAQEWTTCRRWQLLFNEQHELLVHNGAAVPHGSAA